MKNLKRITMICLLFSSIAGKAQTQEMKNIETTITEFAKAGDESDAKKLASYLDDNYRVVMNRLFGSKVASVMTKPVYLEKIRTKEFGGDKRVLTIEQITLNRTTASAKVIFKGTKMTFVSLLTLIQGADGSWKLISDTPMVQ